MDEESTPFFALEKNINVCKQAIELIDKREVKNDFPCRLAGYVRALLAEIKNSPQKFDESCSYYIKLKVAQRLLDGLKELVKFDSNSLPLSNLQNLFSEAFCLCCEKDFWDEIASFEEIRGFARNNEQEFGSFDQRAINSASYELPALLIKHYFQEFSIKEFITNTKKFEQLKTESQRELDEREKRVAALNETLKGQETAFNFVGLNKGFNELSDKKKRELNFAFWGMVTLGIVMIGILLYEFGHITAYTAPIASLHIATSAVPATSAVSAASSIQNTPIYGMLPLAAIEFLLVYFFRIFLSNYRSIKTQLMQIELRMTLCQFIQSYAEYAKDIKVNDKSALDKFENLIFSGILADQQQLPSTFDGLEAIGKLVESVRKK